MEDPVEVQLPSGNRFLVVLRMQKSRDCVPSAPFDDLPLDPRHGSAIKSVIGKLYKPRSIGLTHIVN